MKEEKLTEEQRNEAYAFRDADSVAYLLPKAEAFIGAVKELAFNGK